MAENMQIVNFQTNNYEIQEKTFEGKNWWIVPVKAVKESVLNGQLAPAEEISKFVQAWDDIPIPVNHPTRRGKHVSARNLEVLETEVIGRFRNPEFEDNWLKGEVWIDIEKAENLAENNEDVADTLKMIENNEIMEVSTAYFCDVEQTEGTYNGESYEGIQRNMRPDHLALLPNATGACSVEDGCGIRVNCLEGGDFKENMLEQARTPDYSDTETTAWGEVGLNFEDFRDGYYAHGGDEPDSEEDIPGTVGDAPGPMRQWIVSKTLLGESDAESFEELVVLPVVNPATDALNINGIIAARQRAPQIDGISDSTVQSVNGITATLAEEEFERELGANAVLDKLDQIMSFFQNKFSRGDKEMAEKEELITRIQDYECDCAFNEEQLEEMEVNQLETIEAGLAVNCKPETNEEEETNEEGEEMDVESIKNELKEELREEVKQEIKSNQEEQEKKDLISRIVDNSDYEEEDVEDMKLKGLKKLASQVKPASYVGQANYNSNDEDEVEPLDTNNYFDRGDE